VAQLAQANTALGAGNADSWSIQVIDPPNEATAVPLRKRKIAEVILGGALGGLLVSFLAVVALTPAKKEVWEDELPIGGPFAPDGPPAGLCRTGSNGTGPKGTGSNGVPAAPGPSTPVATAAGRRRLSLGDRRFQSRTPSAPSEEE